jgi:hypothetical protein
MCRAKSNSQGFLSSSKEGENLSLKKVEISPSSGSKSGFNQLKKIKSKIKKKYTRDPHKKRTRG